MVRSIECLEDSKRFDIRWFDGSIFDGSIDRMSGEFEEIRYSIRFDGSIDRISQGFEKVRYSMWLDIRYLNIEYRIYLNIFEPLHNNLDSIRKSY